MNKKELLKLGYKEFPQPDKGTTLFQKGVSDKQGVKYFINCFHYDYSKMNSWDFKIQTHCELGTINISLFNSNSSIKDIEEFMGKAWVYHGSDYYEKFASVEDSE